MKTEGEGFKIELDEKVAKQLIKKNARKNSGGADGKLVSVAKNDLLSAFIGSLGPCGVNEDKFEAKVGEISVPSAQYEEMSQLYEYDLQTQQKILNEFTEDEKTVQQDVKKELNYLSIFLDVNLVNNLLSSIKGNVQQQAYCLYRLYKDDSVTFMSFDKSVIDLQNIADNLFDSERLLRASSEKTKLQYIKNDIKLLKALFCMIKKGVNNSGVEITDVELESIKETVSAKINVCLDVVSAPLQNKQNNYLVEDIKRRSAQVGKLVLGDAVSSVIFAAKKQDYYACIGKWETAKKAVLGAIRSGLTIFPAKERSVSAPVKPSEGVAESQAAGNRRHTFVGQLSDGDKEGFERIEPTQ